MVVSTLEAATPAVLVVEDDPLLGAEISNILERLHFKVTGIASTAHEALSLLEVSMPDLALIDVRLEGSVSSEELASAFHRLEIATVFIGTEPRTAANSPASRPAGGFCPSALYRAICAARGAPAVNPGQPVPADQD